MSRLMENFYEFFETNWPQISDAPENASFAISFIHLELKRECKENYMKVGEQSTG